MPVTEAYYIAGLTRSRGWSEDFVRWQLPPWRGFSYLHADLIAAGHEVIWADRELSPGVKAFREFRARVQAKNGTRKTEPEQTSPH